MEDMDADLWHVFGLKVMTLGTPQLLLVPVISM